MAWSGGVTSPEWSYKHRKSRLQLAVFLTSPSFRDWQVPSIHLLNAGHKLTGVTSQVSDTVRLWTAFSYILTPESEPTNTIPLSVPGLSPLPCSLAEGGALFNTDESPESVVHPVGGKARGRGPPPLSLDTLTHTCLMPFFFSSELGHISNKSSSAYHILPFAVYTGNGQGRRETKRKKWKKKISLLSWPKNNSLRTLFCVSKTQGHTIKYLPKSCTRSACVVRKGLWKWFNSSCAAVRRSARSLSGLWMMMWREGKTLPFFPTCPQFNWVIIWASIDSVSVTDASGNSFNARGSWGSICICMIKAAQ